MEWDKLQVFYHVAKVGSFTLAGQRLNLSQSAISRTVINLEGQIDTILFHRHARGIVLTEQGEILFLAVHRMLQEAEGAQQLIKEKAHMDAGPLRVSTTVGLSSDWLPHYVAGFSALQPKSRLQVMGREEPHDLSIREADVAIRPFQQDKALVLQEYLTTLHAGLYASQAYLDARGTPKTLEDLSRHRFISYGSGKDGAPLDWYLENSPAHMLAPFMEVNSVSGLKIVANAGLGIVALWQECVKLDKNSQLVPVLPHIEGPTSQLFFIYPKHTQSKRTFQLKDFLSEQLLRTEK